MVKPLLATFGVIVCVAGLAMGGAVLVTAAGASARDTSEVNHGMVIGDPPCTWVAVIAERVMSENETRALVVEARNQTPDDCKSVVRIAAPSFLISPRSEEQTLAVPAGRTGSVAWVLSPSKTGTFDIVVSDVLSTYALGLRVTDVLGMSAGQARVVSIIASVFGPMCTFPWWIDKWLQRRKRDNRAEAARASSEPKSSRVE